MFGWFVLYCDCYVFGVVVGVCVVCVCCVVVVGVGFVCG